MRKKKGKKIFFFKAPFLQYFEGHQAFQNYPMYFFGAPIEKREKKKFFFFLLWKKKNFCIFFQYGIQEKAKLPETSHTLLSPSLSPHMSGPNITFFFSNCPSLCQLFYFGRQHLRLYRLPGPEKKNKILRPEQMGRSTGWLPVLSWNFFVPWRRKRKNRSLKVGLFF